MVKNNGGNKAKKFARKSINVVERGTRFAKLDGELYAIVTKLLGNNNCEVLGIDGEIRMCVIRKKFSGKGKRDNLLYKGKWVLIGLRDWQITKKEKEKCDLLEVYSDFNKEMIIKNTDHDFSAFFLLNEENYEQNIIEFSNNNDDNDNNDNNDDNDDEDDNEPDSTSEKDLSSNSSINPKINEFSDMDQLMSSMINNMGLITEDDI